MATPVISTFTLPGADGHPLRGDVRTSGHGVGMPAIVVSHGFKGFKDWGFFPKIAERLAGAGFTVVSFNFSGSGVGADLATFSEPERFAGNTYSNQVKDLGMVIDAVLAGGMVSDLATPSALGLLGHSMGGAASIVNAARRREVRSLVTWAAISVLNRWDDVTVDTWRRDGKLDIVNARTGEVLPLGVTFLEDIEKNGVDLDPLANAARVEAPWLVAHGELDEAVDLSQAGALRDASRKGKLLVIPNGSHTFGASHPWTGATPELERLFDETLDHFVKSLF